MTSAVSLNYDYDRSQSRAGHNEVHNAAHLQFCLLDGILLRSGTKGLNGIQEEASRNTRSYFGDEPTGFLWSES